MENVHSYYEKTGIKERVIVEIRQIARQCAVHKVLLFGSRARGDYRERSDIDLAVVGGDVDRFALLVDEKTWTLLKYDVVNLDGAVQSDLREAIKKDGIVLYEKV